MEAAAADRTRAPHPGYPLDSLPATAAGEALVPPSATGLPTSTAAAIVFLKVVLVFLKNSKIGCSTVVPCQLKFVKVDQSILTRPHSQITDEIEFSS